MKKIYKFGYYTGWFLFSVALFFIYSMIISADKLKLIDIIICVMVIIISIKYFIHYTIYNYQYKIIDNTLFIYCKHKINYQIRIENIKISKGDFKFENKLSFELNNNIKYINIDSDNELINNGNNYRKKWYILFIITIFIEILLFIYSLLK